MNKIAKNIAEWQLAVNEYKTRSEKLQKRITHALHTIWMQSEKYKKCEVQKMIDDAGIYTPLFRILPNISEKFSCSAEEDLMSATMKLDELMAGFDEFLNAPPTKKRKVISQQYLRFYFIIKVEIQFEEPEKDEESKTDDSSDETDSDATDISDSDDSD